MAADDDSEILGYYLKEMDYLRTAGAAFAKKHPHLATALDLRTWPNEDPQIARLIESFGFLTAELQRRFDAQFPEIPNGLLETLYPQLVRPVPSMAIAQFQIGPAQAKVADWLEAPRDTALYAPTNQPGLECRFRTAYPLALWPMEVSHTELHGPAALWWDVERDIELCLRVRLTCQGKNTFADFANPRPLRFFIDGARATQVKLYELLCNRLKAIAVERTEDPEAPPRHAYLRGARIRPCGLETDEAILPYPDNVHQGYRLLQEYFAFPEKFLFVELGGLTSESFGTGRQADLLFLFTETPKEPLMVDRNTLRLGCAPIINLFPRVSEPIRLDHLSLEYRVEGDGRQAGATEIHSIQRVTRTAVDPVSGGDFQPYFSHVYAPPDPPPSRAPVTAEAGVSSRSLWVARRQRASQNRFGGSEIWLSFVDAEMRPDRPAEDVVFAHTLCTNRHLARQLPARARLKAESGLNVGEIFCLARPTAQQDPPLSGAALWQLVSHLSVNTFSLLDTPSARGGGDDPKALKAILRLYGGKDDNHHETPQIRAIKSLKTRKVVRLIEGETGRAFVRGLRIELIFSDDSHTGRGDYLFASVLERFFALYAGVNGFTELVIRRGTGEEDWRQWKPRAGEWALL